MTGTGDRAPVSPLTYASTFDPLILVIGDRQTTDPQPKSGHIANSQAKSCADAVIGFFNNEDVEQNPECTANGVTNSACFSPMTSKTAGWLNAAYRFDQVSGKMVRIDAAFAESPSISGDNYETMFDWSNNLFADTFK